MFNTYQSFFMCMFTLHVFFLFTFEYAPIIFHRYHIIRDAVYVATSCYIILVRMHIWVFPYMVVYTPNLHPKMIIFSRQTHGFVGETHHFRKRPYGSPFREKLPIGDPMRLQRSPTYERLVRFLAGFFGVEPIRWG